MTQKKKKYRPKRRPVLDINLQQLDEIVDRGCEAPLSSEDGELLKTSIHAMADRLMRRFRTTEKASALPVDSGEQASGDVGSESGASSSDPSSPPNKKPRPGHGRHGAADLVGARFVQVPHSEFKPGCQCPQCVKGRLYALKDKSPLIRFVGMPPIQATVFLLEVLRCNLCQAVFKAEPPAGVGEEKYDASVSTMVGEMRYGSGVPFNRLEGIQARNGVLLPASTQFELVDAAARKLEPAHRELIRQAAQGKVLKYDDTKALILDEVPVPEGQDEDRTGLHTTGVVAQVEEHQVALFFTGPRHAGENMTDLLRQRAEEAPGPILTSDPLSCNSPDLPPEMEAALTNCLTHGRRQFTNILEAFPVECQKVVEEIAIVYKHDAEAREQHMDDDQRLAWHKEKSGPVMDRLREWMDAQLEEKKTEPNSGLGKAIRYFQKRWDKLTGFLRYPGAPLDTNTVERALKKAVLHRKNSLFYKTQHGAEVGDCFMSLIHTCELNQVNSFRYLTELQRHADEVRANPAAWLPWNFESQLSPASQ